MSWSELQRLVDQAEADRSLRRTLRRCRTEQELLQAARLLGFRITRHDLHAARVKHQQERRQEARLDGRLEPALRRPSPAVG